MSYDLSRTLFSINGSDFSCAEFLSALDHYGLLDDWRERVCQGKCFTTKAEKMNLELDLNRLGEMTSDFRYSEKLLSSEEFSDWLKLVGMNIADFEEFLKREYWRDHFGEEVVADFGCEAKDYEVLAEMYFSRAFSGLLDSWLKRLLAWYEDKSAKPESFDELEAHYKNYRESLREYFDVDLWQKSQSEYQEEVDVEELQEIFFDEVWKTLKVKYVS